MSTTIESGNYELMAKGREPRFYADGHQAGAAFYAADRADMPRVVRHELMVETIKGERLETPHVTQVAMTAPAPDKPGKFEHVMLEAPPEFKSGYEEARQRQPAKAIDTEDLLAAGPQQPKETIMDQDKARLQINGIEVGRIDFGKESTPSGVRAHFTALRAGREDEVIAAFVDVAKADLEKILGPSVGAKLAQFQGRVGSLSGTDLDVPASEVRREVAPEKTATTAKTPDQPVPQRRLEIDGQPVERMSYVKRQTEQGLRYEVTAYGSGDKVLAKHPALAKEELAAHVGETAAKHLQATRGRNGSLRGDALGMGVPPVQATVQQQPTPEAGPKAATLAPQQQASQAPRPAIGGNAQTLKPADINYSLGTASASSVVWKAMTPETPAPAAQTSKPEPVVNSIEELLLKAGVVPQEPYKLPPRLQKIIDGVARDQAQRTAGTQAPHPDADIKIGSYAPPEVPVDPAERRRQELMASLAERFTINAGEYRSRHDQAQVAFVDRDTAVTTARNEPEVARAMVDLAEAKGWKGLHLKGTEPFKAAAWMEASVRGLPTQGYEPTRADRERLAIKMRERDAALQTNRIEPMAPQQGAAREQAAPAREAATLDPQAAKAREQALGALEVYLKSQNVPKEQMQTLMKQGAETLDKLAAQGKVPEVRVFDAQAQRAHTVHIQQAQHVAAPQRSR
ncbi:LPD7 domain-containing protein [Azohydromonas aeria]|uniref:LPD7 domain-containing protein n=1 Tax=Azohydromonas aeria TaxID=2590212 RepID=UPI0012F9C08A|nr:LPD7 domain-containing protein [Azohydromonas aeria]